MGMGCGAEDLEDSPKFFSNPGPLVFLVDFAFKFDTILKSLIENAKWNRLKKSKSIFVLKKIFLNHIDRNTCLGA